MKRLLASLLVSIGLISMPIAAMADDISSVTSCSTNDITDDYSGMPIDASLLTYGLCDDLALYLPSLSTMNWSGYMVSAPSGVSYRAVEARVTIPSFTRTCSKSELGSWVGIGGVNSSKLIQAGFGIGPTSNTPFLWVMILSPQAGPAGWTISTVPVHVGDVLDTQLIYIPDPTRSSTSGTVVVTFSNTTTGVNNLAKPFKVLVDGSFYYDGSTAEWIDERPLVNGVLANLLNFDFINWAGVRVMDEQTKTWGTMGSEAETRVSMINFNTYSAIAIPELPASTSTFKDIYVACY